MTLQEAIKSVCDQLCEMHELRNTISGGMNGEMTDEQLEAQMIVFGAATKYGRNPYDE